MEGESLIQFGEPGPEREEDKKPTMHELLRQVGDLLKQDKPDEAMEVFLEFEKRLKEGRGKKLIDR